MLKRKDFQYILEEMKQLEQLSQSTFTNQTVKTNQKGRFTVKGLVELNKSNQQQSQFLPEEENFQSSRSKKQTNQLSQIERLKQIALQRSMNRSVDEKSAGQKDSRNMSSQKPKLNQTLIDINFTSKKKNYDLNQSILNDLRDLDRTQPIIQEQILRGLSRHSRESPHRPPTTIQLPTRRAYKQVIQPEEWSLGAGADPLLKELKFSQLAESGKILFKAHFKQPQNAQQRLPPLLDQFSHTLACPVSTQKYNLPPSARIAQNYNESAKGMIIDLNSKAIVIQRRQGIGTFAQVALMQPIASEDDELKFQQKETYQLKLKIEAKKKCFQRYFSYIEKEISDSNIAPIRQTWVNNILDKIPSAYNQLSDETIKSLVDDMLHEVSDGYYTSCKKSILDYVLMDDEERYRLGIMQPFNTINPWGQSKSRKISLPPLPKEEIQAKLVAYTQVSSDILNCWESDIEKKYSLLNLPKKGEKEVYLDEFSRKQLEKIIQVKNAIRKEWVSEKVWGQYRDHIEKLKSDFPNLQKDEVEEYSKHFFASNNMLLSNLTRRLVTKEIQKYLEFFYRFDCKGEEKKKIQELIIEQDKNLQNCKWYDAFLLVNLKEVKDGQLSNQFGYVEDQLIDFSESPQQIKDMLLKIFEETIKVTQNIPKPEESNLNKKEKMTLCDISLQDPAFQEKYNKIEQIIDSNLTYAYEIIYYIQNLQQIWFSSKIDGVGVRPSNSSPIQTTRPTSPSKKSPQPPVTGVAAYTIPSTQFGPRKDEFFKEVNKYYTYYNEISQTLPFFIRTTMVIVDAREIKQRLMGQCIELIDYMYNSLISYIIKRSAEISKTVSYLIENVSAIPESTKQLIELEQLIERIRIKDSKTLQNDFQEITSWLYSIIHHRVKFTDDDLRNLRQTSEQIKNLQDRISIEEERIKDERIKIENSLRDRRDIFKTAIEALRKDIESLDGFGSTFLSKDANDQIDSLNERLEALLHEMEDINNNEDMLGHNQTDYPRLLEAQKKLKPYEELWRLVRDFKNKHQEWTKETIVFKLNSEELEKTTKQMLTTSGQLQKLFKGLQSDKDRSLGAKKTQQVSMGPVKLVEEILEQLMEFQKHVPLAQICSNKGLKQRHWDEISKIVGFPITPDKDLLLKRLIEMESYKYVDILNEISENASREHEIDLILKNMKKQVGEFTCELKSWKDSGTFIIGGTYIEEIEQVLDDQLVKIQSMKNSPFAQAFEEEIKEWEIWLNYTNCFNEYIVKVQSVWLYLEPIFNSQDIVKHLPSEANKFQMVDRKWRNIMESIRASPNLLGYTQDHELLDELKESSILLEVVSKGLNSYLEGKRQAFPRFYFLSNDELLEILSETKDPLRVQPHLKKCFEGISKLRFDSNNVIYGMYSSEEEYVIFPSNIDTNLAAGKVDQWLLEVEKSMISSIKDSIDRSYTEYSRQDREQWVIRRCGQAVLCVGMTYWTSDTETAIYEQTMKQLNTKLNLQLEAIVQIVRQEISPLDRCTLEALIVLDVHNKDVVSQLLKEDVTKITDFSWQAQLRYYWIESNTIVKIINAALDYNYEYLGNSPRLVITSLTDRCYRTLCSAVHLNYGGAPEGPAGTGKTETVKDLAKALARQCVVFNCSDGLDYKAMGKFFRGLASSGAWSCFDEFNRIDLEVLSVVAQQIQTIQLARSHNVQQFQFEEITIPLKATCNVFITMNPGYAGRSELPDNLKALFRSVAMMIPEYAVIAEISLYSFGFSNARTLARKIVTTYKLCSEQLSSQDHYDYGMRAVKSVLTAAGNLKRKYPLEDERILTLKAINEVNSAKFLTQDFQLFQGITQDLFPSILLPQTDQKFFNETMLAVIEQYKLQPNPYFTEKIQQIYEMILVRHGLMVVGKPMAGKTKALVILQETLSRMEFKVQCARLNPKSVSMKQLYGSFDEISHEWTDGVLPVKFRNLVKYDQDISISVFRKWLIFDGPVDAVWIENMNTVLDDNKKLCLNSGEIIAMGRLMNMIFEPMDLEAASPATVSRCGMIYMEPDMLGWRVIYDSWKVNELLDPLFDFYVPLAIEKVRELQPISWVSAQSMVNSMLRILTMISQNATGSNLESRFYFALIWGIGGVVDSSTRRQMEIFLKKLANGDLQPDGKQKKKIQIAERGSVFDYFFDTSRGDGEWVPWITNMEQNIDVPAKTNVQEIFIQTIDSVRYTYLLKISIQSEYPILFCGPTGTGKSQYIKKFVQSLPEEEYQNIELGFSAQTKSYQCQELIESYLDKRRKDGKLYYAPKQGKIILFVDDLSMPTKEKWGAQPPIELLRQLIDQSGWYDLKDKEKMFKCIQNITIVSAMGPQGGGRNEVTPRLLRHMSLLSITEFDDQSLTRIFSSILRWFLITKQFHIDLIKFENKIIQATLDFQKLIVKDLLPTPMKSHYLFNLRDFAKVIFGICQCDRDHVVSQEQMTRLWVHEILRVFGDRLVNWSDHQFLIKTVKNVFQRNFNLNFENVFGTLDSNLKRLIWSDIINVCGGATKKIYEEISDMSYLQSSLENCLYQQNILSDKPMDLVLFDFAIEHLCVIWRVMRQQCGNALLVGVGGSGKQSLAKLAVKFADYQLFQIEISRTYDQIQWKEDLKILMRNTGGKQQDTVFLVDEGQIKEESFLDDINSLLNTCEVPNLFSTEEKNELIEMIRSQRDQRQVSSQKLLQQYIQRVKNHLHVVLTFSPIGGTFRNRLRMFPSLVNCCFIDWFQDWPQSALNSVAQRFLNEQVLADAATFFHASVKVSANSFLLRLKRYVYVTPSSFLDLIKLFKSLLGILQEQNLSSQSKYKTGHKQIIATEKTVESMQTNLIQLQPQLKEAAEATEIKMKEVALQQQKAEQLKVLISSEESIVQEAVTEANHIKDECEYDLSQAMPDLLQAQDSLKVLDKKQIEYLKTMKNPSNTIKDVLQALCLIMYPNPTEKKKNQETLRNEVEWWQASLKLLNNPKLLEEMINLNPENIDEKIISNLGKFLVEQQKNLEESVVENASQACKFILKWIKGIYKCYFVNKKVKPKKEALAQSQEKVDTLNLQLQVKQQQLKDVIAQVDQLTNELQQTERRKLQLEKQYQECSVQLERAKQLIESLGGEKGRWQTFAEQLEKDYEKITGDVLLASGMIAYLGPFTVFFRNEILQQWQEKCREINIPTSTEGFQIEKVLGSPIKIREWQMKGLPSDKFSVSNAIILKHSKRWSLCIDPQGQANRWIKKSYPKDILLVVKQSDGDFLRTLENAIQFGKCVLLENVQEELDPALTPILLKQTFQKGTIQFIKLGDHQLEFSSQFNFIITTKLRNPHYLPSISVKVSLINFMITSEGLNDQLLAILVKKERLDLEQEREHLIVEQANNRKQLQEIEERILQVLSSNKNILTDEEAIEVLTASKVKSNEIKEKQQTAEVTEKNINEARSQYESVSQETSFLFFAISDLNNVDPMYQYSLTYFIDLFTNSIIKSSKSKQFEERLNNIRDHFLKSLYCNITRGLFSQHKFLFSILLTIRLLDYQGKIDRGQLRFLLTGTIPFSQQRQMSQIPEKVLQLFPQRVVNELWELSQLPNFESLPSELEAFLLDWKEIYDSNEPQETIIPKGLIRKYDDFQKLCILRAIRPDKLGPAFEQFVKTSIGEYYLQPPSFDLQQVFSDSNAMTPLIFILSPGTDPYATLTSFGNVSSISLGQGQGPIAAKMIKQAMKSGEWVMLQNCHLAITWMPELEKICEELSSEVHSKFRLWLTSYPSPSFPATILQNGIKMTNEPPKGLKANLIRSFQSDPINNPNFFEGCLQSSNFKKLVFGLCFFHGVIQERKKYGPLGWNIPYEFNESDLRISVRQLRMFLEEDSMNIPFEALKYLTAECNYGGRVTDDKDRRLINTLLNDYYSTNIIEDFMCKLDSQGIYKVPDVDTHQEYLAYLQTQQQDTPPSILGLHENADITRELAEATVLLNELYLCNQEQTEDTTILHQRNESDSTENAFKNMVEKILKEFPEKFDLQYANKKYPVDYRESMNTVLTQEISRFNILIEVIRSSLFNIIQAELGLLQLNTQLEKALKSLQEARVPQLWMDKSYPSKKPLAGYISDLKKRIEFFKSWIDNGTPSIFWLSGFYFTQSFLTGVLQNYARKHTTPIDEIIFDFEFSKEISNQQKEGTLVNGLFFEGCQWNYQIMELDESDPKILFVQCPLILLKPITMKEIINPQYYECPVYKTSARRGELSTTGHSTNFVLWINTPTSRPPSHWIKRGVALLTQLDD